MESSDKKCFLKSVCWGYSTVYPSTKKKCEVSSRGICVCWHIYSNHRSPFPSLVLFLCVFGFAVVQSFTHTVSRSSSGGIWFTSCLVLAHLLRAHLFLLFFPPLLQLWALVFFLLCLALRSDLWTQRRDTGRGRGVLDEGRDVAVLGGGLPVFTSVFCSFLAWFFTCCVCLCAHFPPLHHSGFTWRLVSQVSPETQPEAKLWYPRVTVCW